MRLILVVSAVLALVLSPLAVRAQPAQPPPSISVPRLVNITGVFQPADGQPPAPVEVVTLSIYTTQDGGVPLWQEMQQVTVDATGRFTALLGASQPDGLPQEVFASGEARWMSLLFARPGEAERPRVRITSVPYALKASDAETLGGRPASDYLLAPTAGDESGHKGGAGKGGADDPAAATAESAVTANLVLGGTTNFLAKYVNSADVGNSAVFENAIGAVGLGTTIPADRLHVRFTNSIGTNTGLAVQNMGNNATSFSGMLFYDQNSELAQFQGFNNFTHEYRINNIARVSPGGVSAYNGSINFMTGSTSRFVVTTNGNIGIGTTTPSALLEVSNAVPGGPANMWMTSYTNAINPYYSARRARGTFAAPTAVQIGDGLAGFYGTGRGTSAFGNTFAGGMTVQAAQNWTNTAQGTFLTFTTTSIDTTTAATRMTLAANGNLGIGTTAPSEAVEAVREGDSSAAFVARSYGAEETNGGSAFFMQNARGTRAAPAAVHLGDSLGYFAVGGYGTSSFGADFAAAMGTFAGEDWTDIAQGAGLYFATTPLGSDGAQAHLAVLPSGNVGIGLFEDIPTITDKLQVFGDIRVGTTGTNGCLRNFAGTGMVGTCVSDRRFKKDITPFGPVLGPLTALQPVHYFWRAAEFPSQNFGESRTYGLIAQDAEQVLPEIVVTGADGFKAVDYSKLPLLTIQAVKELKAENDALKHRVAELERLVTEILATSARR
jgi:hypothetical protein